MRKVCSWLANVYMVVGVMSLGLYLVFLLAAVVRELV